LKAGLFTDYFSEISRQQRVADAVHARFVTRSWLVKNNAKLAKK
jgi:hypothetical protein